LITFFTFSGPFVPLPKAEKPAILLDNLHLLAQSRFAAFEDFIRTGLEPMARPRRDGAPATAPNKCRLNKILVKNLQPQSRPYLVWDTWQRGLVIQILPSGHRTWYCLYTICSRLRWYRIADASAIDLDAARLLAGRVMFQVAEGKDPAAERMSSRNAESFEDLVVRHRKYSSGKNKSWQQPDRLIRKHVLPYWSKLRAADISRSDVRTMTGRIEAPIVTNQTLAAASAIFSWAIREEFAGVKMNPCTGIERNATKSRERVLSDSEIPQFWTAFDSTGLLESRALRMILLTGQRPGEVTHMRSTDIIDGRWNLPGDPITGWPGTKNGMSHRVWLSAPAQQIIAEMDATGRVFDNMRVSYLAKAMQAICTKLNVERATPHDLRRTFSTTVTALGFGRDGMNRITNHREGGIADVYDQFQYAAENKKIMETVASRIMQLVENDNPDNVLTFKKRFKRKVLHSAE
jgi:integrase